MTTFNDGDILRQSVLSILNQTWSDLEFLLVDDGSGPETKDILNEFDDPRLTVLPQTNDGLSSARNRALHHAKGDYVCFLDGDDVRAPWALSEAANVIRSKGHPDLICTMGVFSGERSQLSPFFDDQLADAYIKSLNAGGMNDLRARKTWATAMEPQSANKYISRKLIDAASLRFPNDHFFEDILFHGLVVAHAQSIEILPKTRHFTYFQRALRHQITSVSNEKRFDILGVSRVTLQLFQMHADFANESQRGALFVGVLRLLEWCDASISHYHRHAFRLALRETFRALDPVYFVIPDDTPDPRGDKGRLVEFAKSVLD
ncbi:MAG: glycosyltransferase family 2 protein [Pseudomonadota bacterium]